MELFYVLLVILLFARFLGEAASQIRQPPLLGELVAGIIIGLVAAQYTDTFPVLAELTENEVFTALTDLGIFFLMLLGGLELHPKELGRSSGAATGVAVSAMAGPFVLGAAVAWFFLPESEYRIAQIAFVGTALAITAVPVAIRVLMDLEMLQTRLGKVIVSAAVIDDVLSLILLAVLTALIRTGGFPDATNLLLLLGQVILFFVITGAVGLYVLPRLGRMVRRYLTVDELEVSFLLLVALAFAVLAEALSMHFIIGAFFAGLLFSRTNLDEEVYEGVKGKVSGITTAFLAPLFFASIGLELDLSAVFAIPGFLALLVAIAFVGKFAFAAAPARWLGGFSNRESGAIGVAMSARGAVELVIAGIALRAGLFQYPDPPPPVVEHLFSAIVIVAVLTTVAAPLLLRPMLGRGGDGG